MLTVAGVVVAAEQSQFGQIKIKTSVRLRKQRVRQQLQRRRLHNHHNLSNLNPQNKKVYGMC